VLAVAAGQVLLVLPEIKGPEVLAAAAVRMFVKHFLPVN
jgi:hypothetical protein